MVEFRASKLPPAADVFRGMPVRDVNVILKAARPIRFGAGSLVFKQGEEGNCFYMLWQGRGRYWYLTPNGKKLISIWIVPGYVVGGAAILRRPAKYLINMETTQDSLFLTWDTTAIRALAKRFPALVENLFYIAVRIIDWYVAAHAALASQTAQERLAHLLAHMGPFIGERTKNGLELDVSNEELADCVVLTVPTVSRMMSAWEKNGVVTKRRGKLVLHSLDRLFVEIPSLTHEPLAVR
jgi:CRP-like cAMP-binding protein